MAPNQTPTTDITDVKSASSTFEHADANEGPQAVVDLGSFGASSFVIHSVATSGTNPNLAIELQESEPKSSLNQSVGNGDADNVDAVVDLRTGTDTAIMLAASFTTGSKPETISEVEVPLVANGTPEATKVVAIQIDSDNSGDPANADGTLAASGIEGESDEILVTDLPTSMRTVRFQFSTPVHLAASTTYHLVLVGDYTLSDTNDVSIGVVTDASNSNLNVFDTAWSGSSTKRIVFDIDGYAWTALASAYQPDDTSTAGIQRVDIPRREHGSHYRAVTTITGTSTPTVTAALSFVSSGKKYPGE